MTVAMRVGIVGRLLLAWAVLVAVVGLGAVTSFEPEVDQSLAATRTPGERSRSGSSTTDSVVAESPPAAPISEAVRSVPAPSVDAVPAGPGLTEPRVPTVTEVEVPPVTAPPVPAPVSGGADDGWAPQATSAGVHLVDLDSGRVRQLAGPGSFAGLPSPNGRRIALVADVDRSFRFRVEIVDVDSGAVEVVAEALDGSVIGWAPDNRSLLVAIRTPGRDDPTMTEAHVLTPGGETRRVSRVGIDALPIGWSPITNLIAYTAPDGTHVVEPNGANDRLLMPASDGDQRERFAREWSPVGPELLFIEIDRRFLNPQARDDHAIFALNPTTGVRRDLAKPVKSPSYGRWSGDGARVSFTTDEEGGPFAWTTAGPTREVAHELDWAGTGGDLVAIRPNRADGPREVVTITPGGPTRTVLAAHEGGTYFNIAGLPGTRLAVVDIAPEASYR